MKFLALFLALASARGAPADNLQVERDGDSWAITVSGSLPPQPVYRITAGGELPRPERQRTIVLPGLCGGTS